MCMIFPTWQPLASSSHQLAQACGKLLGEKTTHTGTLDPMAEGVIVILSGADRYAKGSFQNWQKTYQFSVLWGVETDSGDQLGKITKLENDVSEEVLTQLNQLTQKIEVVIAAFPSKYQQVIPDFSARRLQGKSSFDLAREQATIPEKKRLVVLENFQVLETRKIFADEVLSQQQENIAKLAGDFRQAAVLQSWSESFATLSGTSKSEPAASFATHSETDTTQQAEFFITEFQVTTSPGTYIRQLVQDVARQVEIPATTWSIIRTQNGPFAKEDCLEITEIQEFKTELTEPTN